MNIVVCIKQVPDSTHIRVHPVTNTIMRQGVPAVINPYDLFAIEAALQIRDTHGGKVTVITMGPPPAAVALRKALAYGCDEAVLITDKIFSGADTLATSYVLASAIATLGKEQPVDLVFTGKQTIDGDTAQVGPGIAKRLNLELLTYVSKIVAVNREAGKIQVERRAEGGVQLLETRLPALITMLEGTNEIRFGSAPDMFRAARAEIRTWDRESAGIEDLKKVGLKGSPTVVSRVFGPTPRAEKAQQIAFDPAAPQAATDALLEKVLAEIPKVGKELERHKVEAGAGANHE
ncbi:MAG: electron transfer flavoprotein subunit beta/FixA family protein [Azonexus sp.]|jgi:electron transfer flavoprotein beta subunit|uniref:electron transfer flavoprotein subunit beta/FixA family protein n=1 Tax=Azonexus sp. TaxID=1872668 RepID=UPI0028223FBF|nr:electron transfer flavoprotein subunit beta/FixA family protein [Azonexus sp.]MDR0776921.1 electron transfer flavoprotein subunit beta/FixA family protein [Azonexus sp.]